MTLTGITQAAALNVSANEVDFGTQFQNGLRLPRYLFVSNNSTTPVAHSAVTDNVSGVRVAADADVVLPANDPEPAERGVEAVGDDLKLIDGVLTVLWLAEAARCGRTALARR